MGSLGDEGARVPVLEGLGAIPQLFTPGMAPPQSFMQTPLGQYGANVLNQPQAPLQTPLAPPQAAFTGAPAPAPAPAPAAAQPPVMAPPGPPGQPLISGQPTDLTGDWLRTFTGG